MATIDIRLDEAKTLGALPLFHRALTPALRISQDAFQRGLGAAAVCQRTALTFDPATSAPLLAFHVRLPDGREQIVSEAVTSREAELTDTIEERGAALATAIRTGLITGRS